MHSGNYGRPRVVPWGASMSLHSVVSCANNNDISVFALSRTCKWGLLISLYELGTCESLFTAYRTLAKCAIRESLRLPERHANIPP